MGSLEYTPLGHVPHWDTVYPEPAPNTSVYPPVRPYPNLIQDKPVRETYYFTLKGMCYVVISDTRGEEVVMAPQTWVYDPETPIWRESESAQTPWIRLDIPTPALDSMYCLSLAVIRERAYGVDESGSVVCFDDTTGWTVSAQRVVPYSIRMSLTTVPVGQFLAISSMCTNCGQETYLYDTISGEMAKTPSVPFVDGVFQPALVVRYYTV
ncbi:hypothetical protein KIPB_001042 [Kipferlia bialata]|uniref:Uncharacterized protein n=1 Tax=Kipferlia bialata TaxID=797122 RepID=A0A9K3CRH1_9EUKA|nr:hypothetical protein KIPB_001042 [Kipferlia bialata]|eukprot:g1042.t1